MRATSSQSAFTPAQNATQADHGCGRNRGPLRPRHLASAHELPAVDVEGGAGDESGVVGRGKRRHAANIGRDTDPADRNGGDDGLQVPGASAASMSVSQ